MIRLSNDTLKQISAKLGYHWHESNKTSIPYENPNIEDNYLMKLRKEGKIKVDIR